MVRYVCRLYALIGFAVLCGAATSMQAQCSVTYVYPPSQNTVVSPHQALQITDPAGEQVATFDLYWGGALVSLKYNGTEYIDQGTSFATGGLVQVALHGPN